MQCGKRPDREDGSLHPVLSIVIPARDEQAVIEATLNELRLDGEVGTEIVVVDDASADDTADLARAVLTTYEAPFQVLTNEWRLGKGGSLKRGIAVARGDAVGFTDADGAVPAHVWHAALVALGGADDRLVAGIRRGARPLARRFVGGAYRSLVRAVLGLDGDVQAPFKVGSRELMARLCDRVEPDGFVFDTWLLAAAREAGIEVVWIDVPWEERERSSSFNIRTAWSMAAEVFAARRRFGRH